jgi:hypothetical protein
MSYDFNNAEKQAPELIPAGTICQLTMNIRPGGSGDGGWIKQSASSDAEMLDAEFTVAEGLYAGRKLWQYMVLSGGKVNERGESIAAGITRATLRAILESARGISPDDNSDAASKGRCISGWGDFCGLTFTAKLGIEKDRTGRYSDRNKIQPVITPGMAGYAKPAQPAAPSWGASHAAPTAPKAPVPSWAR